ncbi:MAG: DUF2961 domain-containing protein [Lentisphaerae bacterium]|nr:MAG: DUF2961 domain-containing protein [Lentisphaerota bacterium]
MSFNGLGLHLGNLPLLSSAQTRSISAENPDGSPGGGARAPADPQGPARELGSGWKTRPCIRIEPEQTAELADITGPGAIQQIWMTYGGTVPRFLILRCYWDDEEQPSVECPIADFFASAFTNYQTFVPLNSLAVCVNPGNAFNCYWLMPFRHRCRITIQNISPREPATLFYQINYTLTDVPADMAYFHAQFRRVNPLPYKEVYTILDNVTGQGHYVGTYLAWGVHNNGWWGEGEIKFYLDDDTDFPTICGTGTEDYFCGSYNFENKTTRQYQEFSTAYAGMPHVVRPDGLYNSQQRFSLYRWHILDPIRFQKRLRVTIQALGWRSGGRFLPLQDDIASVAFWYQNEPHQPFPTLPSRDELEII